MYLLSRKEVMPVESERQRRFLGAELGRKRAGKKTKTDMSETQLSEYLKGAKKQPLKAKKKTLRRKKHA